MEVMGRYWWIWTFVFISCFQLLMIVIYLAFIAPLFNKFEPLKDGELGTEFCWLSKLASTRAASTDGLARALGPSNAYFTG
jgi:STE24 endopeptidase